MSSSARASSSRPIRIRSNIPNLQTFQYGGRPIEHTMLGEDSSLAGALRDYRAARDADLVVISAEGDRLIRLALLAFFLPRRFRIISLDLILARPRTFLARIAAFIKRLLLTRVDHFYLYHRDISGYEKFYGIRPSHSTYIPFKVNVWDALQGTPPPIRDDGYFVQIGRTYRDVPTFLRACELAGVPGVLCHQGADVVLQHGTNLEKLKMPPNVRDVLQEGGRDGWLEMLGAARSVVIPVQPGTINSAGISTALDAMALGKCVIISRGVTTEGVISDDEAVIVPPGDAEALAAAMRRVNDDAEYRERIASAGQRLAYRLGGEERLLTDLLDAITVDVDGR